MILEHNYMRLTNYLFVLLLSVALCSCEDSPSKNSVDKETNSQKVDHKESVENTNTFEVENPNRAYWQKPDEVIASLGALDGLTIADLGAGSGYFAFRLVFKADRVIALDIDRDMIEIMEDLKADLPERFQSKFETRLATETDSKLESEEVDLILIVNTIAYIENRVEYLSTLKNALKPNGRVMILDFKMQNLPIPDAPDKSDRVYIDVIEDELLKAGFEDVITDDMSLNYQYIVKAHK